MTNTTTTTQPTTKYDERGDYVSAGNRLSAAREAGHDSEPMAAWLRSIPSPSATTHHMRHYTTTQGHITLLPLPGQLPAALARLRELTAEGDRVVVTIRTGWPAEGGVEMTWASVGGVTGRLW